MVDAESLTPKERKTAKHGRPIPITTANGVIGVKTKVNVFVRELGISVWAYILPVPEGSPPVSLLSLGALCDEEGYTYVWKPKKRPTLTKDGVSVKCKPLHNFPFITSSYNLEDEDDEPYRGDDDMPDLIDSSSDEEGEWTEVKKKKKPRRKKKSKKAPPSKSAEELLHDHSEGRAAKPRSCG